MECKLAGILLGYMAEEYGRGIKKPGSQGENELSPQGIKKLGSQGEKEPGS